MPSIVLNSAAAMPLCWARVILSLKVMNSIDALESPETAHTEGYSAGAVVNLVENIQSIQGANRIALRDPNNEGHPLWLLWISKQSQ